MKDDRLPAWPASRAAPFWQPDAAEKVLPAWPALARTCPRCLHTPAAWLARLAQLARWGPFGIV